MERSKAEIRATIARVLVSPLTKGATIGEIAEAANGLPLGTVNDYLNLLVEDETVIVEGDVYKYAPPGVFRIRGGGAT